MNVLSLFSGCGGLDLGLERAGHRIVAHAEVDPHASAVLAYHHPDVPNLGDVSAIDWTDWTDARIDLLAGGPPCQDFSVAGRRAGLDGARGQLLVIGWLRAVAALRPPWLLLENVPGLLDHRDGMGALVGSLADLGYGVAWRVLDAQHFGVPQRRRRLFVLAAADDDPRTGAERAARILLDPESGSGHLAAIRSARQSAARTVAVRADAARGPVGALCTVDRYEVGQADQLVIDGPCAPLLTPRGGGPAPSPDDADQLVYVRGGDGGYWNPSGATSALTAVNGRAGVRASRSVVFVRSHRASNDQDPDRWQADELGPTLNLHDDTGPARAVAFVVQANGLAGGGTEDIAVPTDVAGTLRAGDGNRGTFVCVDFRGEAWAEADMASPLRASALDGHRGTSVVEGHRVRRLLPVERERLMGWPDGWTRYGRRPDGTVYELPDTARHRATGNGVVAPVTEWIGHRLAAEVAS